MRALKRWVRSTWAWVILPKPEQCWEDFEKFNPVSAQITKEFLEKHQKRLNSFIDGLEARYSEKTFRCYVSYYLKRHKELRKEPKCASLRRRRRIFRHDRKQNREQKWCS